MYSEPSKSPLSRLLEDDAITILEHLIPCCPPTAAKILALRMKFMEIQKIMTGFDDESQLKACGFEDSSPDFESVLHSLRETVSGEKARQIDSLLQMLSTVRLFRQWQEMLQAHPELMQLFSQSVSNASTEKGGGKTNDAFTDPSLFFMLNSLMNGEDMNADAMKKIIDMTMKSSR